MKLFGKRLMNKNGRAKFAFRKTGEYETSKFNDVQVEKAVRANLDKYYEMTYGYTLFGNPMNR